MVSLPIDCHDNSNKIVKKLSKIDYSNYDQTFTDLINIPLFEINSIKGKPEVIINQEICPFIKRIHTGSKHRQEEPIIPARIQKPKFETTT